MILLNVAIFIFFVVSLFTNLFTNKKNVNKTINICVDKVTDNVEILEMLNYYCPNVKKYKEIFIIDCMVYMLNFENPNTNYLKEGLLDNESVDDKTVENFINKFVEYSTNLNKSPKDFTFNELVIFIKKQDIYKNYENKINIMLNRSIVLSQYLNDTNSNRLIKALTSDELKLLNN